MRLFVAVWPPADVIETVRGLERADAAGVRWTREDQWHVTLRFLGSVEEEVVPEITAALDAIAGAGASSPVVMGPETKCFGREILQVPVEGLTDLAARVVEATASFGEPPDERPFRGHLTLARSGNRRRGNRGSDLRSLAGAACAGAWTVDELTLVCSRPHREGVRYDVLHRTRLRAL
jgi:2'-5' RNA ligase